MCLLSAGQLYPALVLNSFYPFLWCVVNFVVIADVTQVCTSIQRNNFELTSGCWCRVWYLSSLDTFLNLTVKPHEIWLFSSQNFHAYCNRIRLHRIRREMLKLFFLFLVNLLYHVFIYYLFSTSLDTLLEMILLWWQNKWKSGLFEILCNFLMFF